jgi:phosphatidyl-myo-inositol dimannoside synthase
MTARLLALVSDAYGGRGGIAQYNRDFLSSLAKSGLVASITVLPRHAPGRVSSPPGVEQLSPRPGRLAYALRALLVAIGRRSEIVFCGHLYMVSLAAMVARLRGAKLVVQMHGIEAWRRPSALRRKAVEAADLVLCVSRYTRSAVLSWATIAPERVLVLPNTVEETFTPGNGSVLRAELGLTDRQVLLTVGRMDTRERYKGHDRVIAAIPRLVAEGHDVAYVIIGEGKDRARLELLAAESGIAERVIFLGSVQQHRLLDAYRMADVFVMPSTGEGFGIAFLEAMASGTPALGLMVTGAVDALADGELGAITPEEDLPAAISRLLARPKPDPAGLAAAVRARFGPAAFAANVRAAILRLFLRQPDWMQSIN